MDFADKLVQLIEDDDLRHRMGVFGHNRLVKELAWEFSVPQLLAAYSRVFSLSDTKGRSGERY